MNGNRARATPSPPYLARMRLLTVLSALVVFALASPAALAEPCRDMGRAAEPTTRPVGPLSGAEPGTCCSVGSGCGVCCLAPTPYAPESAPATVTLSVTAAVFVAVVLSPPATDRASHEAASGDGPPRPPDRLGASGPRGPPAC